MALLVIAAAGSDPGPVAALGGLGLNMAIVGLFFVLRPLARRVRARLPPWLPW